MRSRHVPAMMSCRCGRRKSVSFCAYICRARGKSRCKMRFMWGAADAGGAGLQLRPRAGVGRQLARDGRGAMFDTDRAAQVRPHYPAPCAVRRRESGAAKVECGRRAQTPIRRHAATPMISRFVSRFFSRLSIRLRQRSRHVAACSPPFHHGRTVCYAPPFFFFFSL